MKLEITKIDAPNPLAILRRAGYSPFTDPKTGKESFILRPTPERYPRFHLYLKENDNQLIFDLHLDQKQASYKGSNMHGGEYDGPTVEKELNRIHGWIKAMSTRNANLAQKPKAPEQSKTEKRGKLFGGLFG